MTAYTKTYDLYTKTFQGSTLAQVETIDFFKGTTEAPTTPDLIVVYDNSENVSSHLAVAGAGGGTYPDSMFLHLTSPPSFEVESAERVRLVFETSEQGAPINNTDTVTVEYLDADGNVVGTTTLYTVHSGNTWGGRLNDAGQTDEYVFLTDDPSHVPGSTSNVYIFGDLPDYAKSSGFYFVGGESWKDSDFSTPEGHVDGTSADDVIDASYADDPDGDVVDGDDAALNGATGQDDNIRARAGNDRVFAGEGDDVINGEAGNDTLTGGSGNDVFVETAGDGADIVTDFGAGEAGSIDDGDQTNNDFVDLENFYTTENRLVIEALGEDDFASNIDMLRQDAADGRLDGIINGNDYSSIISGLDLTLKNDGIAVTGDALTYDNTNVICFARGVRIATGHGEVAVENLQVGDRVVTRDNGFQKIRWIGSTSCRAEGKLAPILFKKGSIGNTAEIMVSPNHRMLVRGIAVELVSGDSEALIPAKFMVNDEDIVSVEGGVVEYFHILFDRHELIWSHGCWSESFLPGEMGWNAICEGKRQEILSRFPTLCQRFTRGYGAAARQVLDRPQAIAVLGEKEMI